VIAEPSVRARAGARPRVSIGPASPRPSWQWLGPDTAAELAHDHEVSIFERFDAIPVADVVVIVKDRPSLPVVAGLVQSGARLVYVPIDAFTRREQLCAAAGFLKACSAILSHSEALSPYLEPYGRHVCQVEHHTRLTLCAPADYRADGYVLWSGALQHLPYLLAWLERHPLPHEVKIITDLHNPGARRRALAVARSLGVRLTIDSAAINGLEARPWSADGLLGMMAECRGIIDIKGSDFGQSTKPPTKGQQAIASGIAFACNPAASTARYLRRRGFEPANPLEPDRWFDRAYWEQTRALGRQLREELTIENVVAPYRDTIRRLLNGAQAPR
jgi:hypothetical protein